MAVSARFTVRTQVGFPVCSSFLSAAGEEEQAAAEMASEHWLGALVRLCGLPPSDSPTSVTPPAPLGGS